MKNLKKYYKMNIGMIGYNEGNGHPYSFSAIINGYDQAFMDKSPYPVIGSYLAKRNKEEFGIGSMKVTHIWCPDKKDSTQIASCTFIKNCVDDYSDMLGKIDAVIIARDDVDSHFKIASFFFKACKRLSRS